jgi:antitoxin CptB
VDERTLSRLRWRCRRGMLENDIVLGRFLDARGAQMSDSDASALTQLLDLSDNDLWDLLSGRIEPADAAVAPLVECLRAA